MDFTAVTKKKKKNDIDDNGPYIVFEKHGKPISMDHVKTLLCLIRGFCSEEKRMLLHALKYIIKYIVFILVISRTRRRSKKTRRFCIKVSPRRGESVNTISPDSIRITAVDPIDNKKYYDYNIIHSAHVIIITRSV